GCVEKQGSSCGFAPKQLTSSSQKSKGSEPRAIPILRLALLRQCRPSQSRPVFRKMIHDIGRALEDFCQPNPAKIVAHEGNIWRRRRQFGQSPFKLKRIMRQGTRPARNVCRQRTVNSPKESFAVTTDNF